MSHYSNSPNDCRVDFFKPSGKWSDTICLHWNDSMYRGILIHKAFRELLEQQINTDNLRGYQAICLEPYHEHSHPISIII